MEMLDHATTYRSWQRFVSTVVALAVVIGLTLIAIQASSDSPPTLPSSGTIVVTAFGKITALNGSSEPTSEVISDAQAAALRIAVDALPRLQLTPKAMLCMEEATVFTISVRRSEQGVRSTTWRAAADMCPAPGVLHPTKPPPSGVRYCPLGPLIISFFPKGTVAATRLVLKRCRSTNSP
jgi:hypothetical protein